MSDSAAESSAPVIAVSRRRLTIGTAIQIGGRVFGALLGVIVAATLARALSRPQFGQLSLALALATLGGTLGDLGIKQIAVREMARAPERRGELAGALVTAQLVTGTILALIGAGISFALMKGQPARIMAALVMATLPLGAISSLTVAFQARLRPEVAIVPMLVQNVVWVVAVVVLGATGASLELYGAASLFAAAVQALVAAGFAARMARPHFAGSRRLIVEMVKLSWPIGLAGVFVSAYYRIDGVILFHYRGATATAYYSAAYRVIDVLQIFPMTVSGVLLPLLAGVERGEQTGERSSRAFEFAVVMLLAVTVPVAILGGILAPGVVSLVYGGSYHRSVLLLRILLPAIIPIGLGYILTSQLILRGQLRPYIAITFAGAVVNVVVNAVGIPIWGAPVAAWTTVGTELVVMTGVAVVVRIRYGLRLPIGRIARCVAATLVTAVAVWLVRGMPLAVGLLVAAILYPPVLLASGAVSLAELRGLLTRDAAAHA